MCDSLEVNPKVNIESFIRDIDTFRETYSELYKPEYDFLREDLESILQICETDPSRAYVLFEDLPISSYDCFEKYVSANDIEAVQVLNLSTERTKSKRNRHMRTCPHCGNPITFQDGNPKCLRCGVLQLNTMHSSTRTSSDTAKHIHKQLDSLTGTRKPPANIERIISFIITWLTDLRFIHDYLVSEGVSTLHGWMSRYNKLMDTEIDEMLFFNRTVERDSVHAWSYKEFEHFIRPFHKLLDTARRYSRERSSNVEQLTDDDKLVMFADYIKQHGKHKPARSETFNWRGVEYEIGGYLVHLSLLFDVEAEHIKSRLETLFGMDLTMPGLMFSFNDVYALNENVPKRYNYQQEYIYIVHETFHVEYVTIPISDKKAIVELVQSFNEFYKQRIFDETGKRRNAPLYCCVLTRIFQLERFKQYRAICNFIPRKDTITEHHIASKWFEYSIDHDLSKFMTVETDPSDVVSNASVHNDEECEVEYEEEYEEEFNDESDDLFEYNGDVGF